MSARGKIMLSIWNRLNKWVKIFLMIVFFPVTVTVIVWPLEINKILKGAIILLVWAFYISTGNFDGLTRDSVKKDSESEVSNVITNDQADTSILEQEKVDKIDYSKIQIEASDLYVNQVKVTYINPKVYYNFKSNHPIPEYDISNEDYEKYTAIMDYLWKFPSTSETILYEELAVTYNESASDLKEFVMNTMVSAINRDQGRTSSGSFAVDEEFNLVVISKFFETNATNIQVIKESVVMDKGLLNVLVKGKFLLQEEEFDFIIKIRYSSDLQTITIFDLKVKDIIIGGEISFRSIYTIND